tara:strand:+ start:208 stop:891 length:684 start_codon:yes stop_codon:yes gene_type:complete
MIKKDKKNLGLTIIEALVSTVVVGIGFIAVFQMTNFSVRSIDTSSERTKANYLVSMMAEDVLGHSRTVHGVNTLTGDYAVDIDGSIQIEGVKQPTARLFTDHLAAVEFRTRGCDGPAIVAVGTDTPPPDDDGSPKSIYETEHIDASSNKEEKWMRIFSENRYLKCKGENDVRRLKMYKICRWGGVCDDYNDPSITDDGMFIGRVQVNLNNGKKRKFLYFQADYNIRK